MADLSDLRTAVRDVVDEASAPAFESLVRRARDRRRRRHISLVAAAALVLTGTASLLAPGGRTSGAPSPAESTGSPTPSATSTPQATTAEEVITRGRLYSYGSGGSGVVLTVWKLCGRDSARCHYAWRLADRSGEVGHGPAGAGDGSNGPLVHAGGGGYVLKSWDRPGFVVRDDGTVAPLESGEVNPVDEDSVAVRAGGRRMELVDPRTGLTQLVPDVPDTEAIADAQVAPGGTVWAMPAFAGPGKVEVTWLRDGVWRSHAIVDAGSSTAMPGALAVAGDRTAPTRVAALSSYDGATVLPVGVLAVSVDGGATWRHLTGKDLPFEFVDSLAATAGGTLFVAEPDGTLWRSANGWWTSFRRVTGTGPVDGLEPAGEQVLARMATKEPGLVLLADDGSTEPVRTR